MNELYFWSKGEKIIEQIESLKNGTNHKNNPKTKQKLNLKYSGEMI